MKKGISLITLVITIIVVVIISAAVILSLSNNDILNKTSDAKYLQDLDSMQAILDITQQDAVLKNYAPLNLKKGQIASGVNVSSVSAQIDVSSYDLPNFSAKIIFDIGTNTNSEFYTGNKLPIYGSTTTWYINSRGKLALKVGSRVYGDIDDETKDDEVIENPKEDDKLDPIIPDEDPKDDIKLQDEFTVDYIRIDGLTIKTLGDIEKYDEIGNVPSGSVFYYKNEYYVVGKQSTKFDGDISSFLNKSTFKINVEKGFTTPSKETVAGDLKREGDDVYAFVPHNDNASKEWEKVNWWVDVQAARK